MVYTKPRQVAREPAQFEGKGFELCGPRHPKMKVGASVRRIEPMFPRYLFLRPMRPDQSLAVISSTLGVSNLVRFGLEPAVVRAEVIQNKRALESWQFAAPFSVRYPHQPGDRVRIEDGHLACLEGIVDSVGEKRVIALITFLGRASAVRVEPEHLAAP